MKELSTKEKAEAYDEAIERAKKWYNAPNIDKMPTYGNRIIEEIFPELKESGDEEIRKALIKYYSFDTDGGSHALDNITPKQIVTWLEKQGNPTDINPSEFDLRLNKLLKQFETLPKEELASSLSFYLNVVQNDGTYREEKQGEQKHADKVEPKDYNGIDPHFGKPVDKVEPKFKVGDWVVENGVNRNPVQITSFEEDKGVGIKVWFSNGTGTWVDFLIGYHKWTIEDAKDGDVLVASDGSIFLFATVIDCACKYYVALTTCNDIKINTKVEGGYWETSRAVQPATKEQRERFFAAMHDAGYEWDADKLELYKKPKFKVGEWITDGQLTCKVLSVTGKSYELHLYNDDYCHFETGVQSVDKHYHLWTIQDTHDGDVLTSIGFHSNCTFIFKGLDNWKFDEPNGDRAVATGYCCLSVSSDKMEFGIQGPDCVEVNTIKPATKIQRDLLFQKMKEAGYEWDAEKKELKKIENETEIPFGVKDSELHEVSYYIPEGFYAEIDDDGVIIKKGKKPAAWSGEDSTYYDDICEILINLIHSDTAKVNKDVVQRDLNWLTSIKQRIETK